jgi:hypothetical protein
MNARYEMPLGLSGEPRCKNRFAWYAVQGMSPEPLVDVVNADTFTCEANSTKSLL